MGVGVVFHSGWSWLSRDYFAPTGLLFLLNPKPRVALRSTLGYHISPLWGFGRVDRLSPWGWWGSLAGKYRLHFSGGVSTLGDLSEGPTGHNEITRARDYFAPTGLLFFLALNQQNQPGRQLPLLRPFRAENN